MIKVIIIDDEFKAQETLEMLLHRYFKGKFQVLAKCSSVDEGVIQIQKNKPDILFLDIQMPTKNGFALFDEIKPIDFDVVITSAYEEHALKALNIDKRVFRYLLKPINQEDLETMVRRYEEKVEEESWLTDKLEKLAGNMSNLGIHAYGTQEGLDFIHQDDISYCVADGNYTTIFRIDGTKLIVSKNLGTIEETLPPEQFIRIHHGTVVNVKQILRIDKKDDYLILKGGEKISGSSRKMKDFKKYFAY